MSCQREIDQADWLNDFRELNAISNDWYDLKENCQVHAEALLALRQLPMPIIIDLFNDMFIEKASAWTFVIQEKNAGNTLNFIDNDLR